MNDLICLAYISTLSDQEGPQAVSKIIQQSRRNNALKNICGILIFDGLRIFQYLEGHQKQVTDLYEVIRQDPRHTQVDTLFQTPLSGKKKFNQWAMGYANTDDADFLVILKQQPPELIVSRLGSIHQQVDFEPC